MVDSPYTPGAQGEALSLLCCGRGCAEGTHTAASACVREKKCMLFVVAIT